MRVLVYQRCEFRHRFYFRSWFIAVPLQIAALPEYSPDAAPPDVCRLRHRRFVFLFERSPPSRSDLENLYALPGNTEADIQLGANTWRRPTLLHEGVHRSANARQFNLRERHRLLRHFPQIDGMSLQSHFEALSYGAKNCRQIIHAWIAFG